MSSCLLGLSWRLYWPEGPGINCKFNEIMKNLSGVRWSVGIDFRFTEVVYVSHIQL